MKNWQRVLALIILSSLPIWIDEVCKFYQENYYCKILGPYLGDPEPVSMGNNDFPTFSFPYGVSGSTETAASQVGTLSNSTTTTI